MRCTHYGRSRPVEGQALPPRRQLLGDPASAIPIGLSGPWRSSSTSAVWPRKAFSDPHRLHSGAKQTMHMNGAERSRRR